MSTEHQKRASRANGSKSRGPVTPGGKLNSSRNALKHGMLSEIAVLECESTDRFNQLLAMLYDEFEPQTDFEESLIVNMAVARWRQSRICAMEKAALDHEVRRQAEMSDSVAAENAATRTSLAFRRLSDESRSLDLIKRYDSSFERQYYRAHRRFLEVRDRRVPPSGQPESHSPLNEGISPVGGGARIHEMPTPVTPAPPLGNPGHDTENSKRTPEVIANKPSGAPLPPSVLSSPRRRFRYRRAKPVSTRTDRSSSLARTGSIGVNQGDTRGKVFIRR